ncbi:MAG: DUF4339 domain-containing protein [Planctomycetota bacterium]|nr:DUF4339 domain-containing protein [Planctomycetota bacterium]
MMNQQRLGPVTTQVLLGMIQSSSVSASTLVWRDGMENWTPVGAIPEFSYALSSSDKNKEVVFGLNMAGVVVFIILLLCCIPLCWLPWVIDSLKAKNV